MLAGGDAGAKPLAQLRDQNLQLSGDAPDVGARTLGLIDGKAPDRLAFDEVLAQSSALEGAMLREEWIGRGEARNGFEEGSLSGGNKPHVQSMYLGVHRMYMAASIETG